MCWVGLPICATIPESTVCLSPALHMSFKFTKNNSQLCPGLTLLPNRVSDCYYPQRVLLDSDRSVDAGTTLNH